MNNLKFIQCTLYGWILSFLGNGYPLFGYKVSGHIHEHFKSEERDENTVWLIDKCVYCGSELEVGWCENNSLVLAEYINTKRPRNQQR